MNKIKLKLPKLSFSPFSARLSLREQALFAKRLALLVKAGVPLLKSLTILGRQTKSRATRKMFERISHDVENGQFLSKSLTPFKRIFGDFAINIIRVGETSGTLSENLKYLADELDKKRRLRQKVIGALVYPIVIMIAALAVSGLMTVYLFPKLLPIFKSLNVDLPFMTRALLFLSNFLTHYWFFLILSLVVFAGVFAFLMRLKPFRFAIHRINLSIPVVGPLFKDYYLVNICRTLGILVKSSVHILEATTIAADTSTNLVYRKELQNLHRSITRGSNLTKHFEKNPRLFPIMLSQMIDIGETTGNLSDTFLYLADMYEEDLDEQTKRLSSVIEPVMMIGMGLLVGFIAVSIITPIYEVTKHLNPR